MKQRLLLNQIGLGKGNEFKWLQNPFGVRSPILLSVLFFFLTTLSLQNLQAQCGITPDPITSPPAVNIAVNTTGSTVRITRTILNNNGISPVNSPGVGCTLYIFDGTILRPSIDITCGTPNPSATPPTFAEGTYQVVADDDGVIDAVNTSAMVDINISITDNGVPSFMSCTPPPSGPLMGGAYGTNADGVTNNDCRTAIPSLLHPDTDDNCDGETLAVVYDNTNDPNNSSAPVTCLLYTSDAADE